ncbi:MAG TPA: aminotransferase class V-fold PLP-dependent enzyme [Solirubrobacteraceae bacterium]|nr:aminotransferase class V-fold PLP-dependent enzyme [Solirubrobacteraceae bacterium]
MDALRSEFPVLERVAFLNTGTDGPVPARAVEAAREALADQLREGRHGPHFSARFELQAELRGTYAQVLGCAAEDVALTTSTSEGLGAALGGLDLGAGDEIVTSDSEHPGLVGPLIAARARGVAVRAVPLREVADAVTARTTLVACSHVSWVTGEVAPAALAELDVPVVFDGAQGAGAIPVDVGALGCAAYAASGQKWLCGADGTGMLYVEPAFRERLRVLAPSWVSFEDTTRGLDSPLHESARRFDTPSLSREAAAFSLASTRLLLSVDDLHARAAALAARLADALSSAGRTVAPRGETTLVSWHDADAPATRDRLAAAGVVIRDLPGRNLLRASVGAWNDESDLERLLSALSAGPSAG